MQSQLSLLEPTKLCSACGQIKPIGDFYRSTAGYRDGMRPDCKPCSNAKAVAWGKADRAANPEKYAADKRRSYFKDYRQKNAERRAAQARERYRRDPVQREQIKANGRKQKERDPRRQAARERRQAWRESAPERRREKNRRANGKRRAVLTGAKFIENVNPLVLLELDDGVCGICGVDVDPFDFHIDHMIPLSRGGEHSYANTQVAHPACNLRKGNRLLEAA